MSPAYLLLVQLLLLFLRTQTYGLPSTSGFPCSTNNAAYPCQAYAFYRAGLTANLTDIASIGDFFGVSGLMIAHPSNISESLVSSPLVTGQPLFIPLSCSCNPINSSYAISYYNATRNIQSGETYYELSVGAFGNLTTYQSVEIVNPTPVPTNGVDTIFPIFCKCPNSSQHRNGINLLVSYVFQPTDNLTGVAALFGAQEQGITGINGANIQPYDTIFIPVSKLPSLNQPTTAAPGPALKEEKRGLVIGLSVGGGMLGALFIFLVAVLFAFRGKWWGKERFTEVETKETHDEVVGTSRSSEDCLDKCRVFKINELEKATGGFHVSSLIQGSVYKGSIDGEVYAIKKTNWNAYEELKILQKANHVNVVKLEGFCIDPEKGNCYLIYEFVENGSLYSWLHESPRNEKLSWKTRLQIAIDVANGLQYIQEHTRPRVIHKNIESSNILLDSNMQAKITNFGRAKCVDMDFGRSSSTLCSISPEFRERGVVSTKMDVFSFGVVLLELISGREAINKEGEILQASAYAVYFGQEDVNEVGLSERLRAWMDKSLVSDSFSFQSVMNVMALAVACVSKDPRKRPSMVDIVYVLCKSDDFVFDVSEYGGHRLRPWKRPSLSAPQVLAR